MFLVLQCNAILVNEYTFLKLDVHRDKSISNRINHFTYLIVINI